MICKSCGRANELGARFCKSCGAPLESDESMQQNNTYQSENVYQQNNQYVMPESLYSGTTRMTKKEFNECANIKSITKNITAESSPNLCVNSSFSYVVLSTLLLSSKDLTEWSLVYHSTLSYQRFYDLHSIHYDHLEGLHQLI